MNHRERALAAYAFEPTDKPCLDLMEGTVWPELLADFEKRYGLSDDEAIQEALGSDFRWTIFTTGFYHDEVSADRIQVNAANYSDELGYRPLKDVQKPQQIKQNLILDVDRVRVPDFYAFRKRYPDHALVCCPGWMPAFSGACSDFGMETALSHMALNPKMIETYVALKTEYALAVIEKCMDAGAAKMCDFFWLGDDFASESSMILSPDMWRGLFKPGLKKQVEAIKKEGMHVMFHSCGDVSAVYEDFIEIGISSHIGVQTSCKNLQPVTLANKVGGRLVIHGGVDAQTTLVEEDFDGVVKKTEENMAAFSACGGYVVSNSHHGMPDIGAEKIAAMSAAAGRWCGASDPKGRSV